MPRFVDLTGQKFGALEVVSFFEKRERRSYWNCRCECGSIRVLRTDDLKNGSKCKECSSISVMRNTGKFVCNKCDTEIKIKEKSLKSRIKRRDNTCRSCRNEYRIKRHSERLKEDPIYAEKDRVRRFIHYYLTNGGKNGCEAEMYLCMKQQEFKDYIAADFTDPNMKWGLLNSFHLDHIHPLAEAKTKEQIRKAWHYTNLQPLTPAENVAKGSKLNWRKNDI